MPYAKPLYYGNLFMATAFAGGGKQVVSLVNETSLVAYAIYDAATGTATTAATAPMAAAAAATSAKLASIAIINLEAFNSTQPASISPYVSVNLPLDAESAAKARVGRLTAPGVDAKQDIVFAGQYVDSEERIAGALEIESLLDGAVRVSAGEAVLVQL